MFNFKEIISSIADAGQKLFSIKKIVEDIGWMPKFSIKEGIQDYFANIN